MQVHCTNEANKKNHTMGMTVQKVVTRSKDEVAECDTRPKDNPATTCFLILSKRRGRFWEMGHKQDRSSNADQLVSIPDVDATAT